MLPHSFKTFSGNLLRIPNRSRSFLLERIIKENPSYMNAPFTRWKHDVSISEDVKPWPGLWWIPENPWRVTPAAPLLNAEVVENLRKKEVEDWSKLSNNEKELLYRLEYGTTLVEVMAGKSTTFEEKRFIAITVSTVLTFAVVSFIAITRYVAKPSITKSEEWKRASREYLIAQKANPISGNI